MLSGRFEEAAEFGASRELPLELVLGPSPGWTHPRRPGAYSAVLARPRPEWRLSAVADVDRVVDDYARRAIDRAGAWPVERAFEPPLYSVADLLSVAGEAAIPPLHFAAFLPEDEGQLGATTKTLVYRNFYELRLREVSSRLFKAIVAPDAGNGGAEASADPGCTSFAGCAGTTSGTHTSTACAARPGSRSTCCMRCAR